ncbi:MAG: CsgG/HfaB family protein [Candidatus Omnitrophota bacterium]
MKKKWVLLFIGLLSVNLAGCQTIHKFTTPSRETSSDYSKIKLLPSYSGLKSSITVADFDVKAAKASTKIGAGLRDMLVWLLKESNRFLLTERNEIKTNSGLKESSLQKQDSVMPEAVVPESPQFQKDNVKKPADLIITAQIVGFEPKVSGGSDGVGGGGGAGSGVLGGLLGTTLNKAYISLDIRIVDAATSEVLAATKIQGQAADTDVVGTSKFFDNWDLGSGLEDYSDTPMEKAIRICLVETVRYIAETVPASYYKYQ